MISPTPEAPITMSGHGKAAPVRARIGPQEGDDERVNEQVRAEILALLEPLDGDLAEVFAGDGMGVGGNGAHAVTMRLTRSWHQRMGPRLSFRKSYGSRERECPQWRGLIPVVRSCHVPNHRHRLRRTRPRRRGIALAEALRDPRKGTLLLASAYPLAALLVGGSWFPRSSTRRDDHTKEMLAAARARLREGTRIRAVPSESAARALTETGRGRARRPCRRRLEPSWRDRPGAAGTTAERLLHGAPCAVAVAPRGYRSGPIRRIGVAYNGSPEAEAALHAAEALAVELRAALTVYCVVEPTPPSAAMIAAGTGAEWPSHSRQGPRSPPPLGGERQRAGGSPARDAAPPWRAGRRDRSAGARRDRPALHRLARVRTAPLRAPGQRLRRARARRRLPRRRDAA